jgi:hypothetical protein
MRTIIVTTQTEWDALPEKFGEPTEVRIQSDPNVWLTIKKCPGSSRVEAWGSSRVVARGSSRVVARGSSRVVAREWSRVEAWGSSRVEARESSSVKSYANSVVLVFATTVAVVAWHFVTVICQDCRPTIKRHGTHVTIVRTKTMKHTPQSFADIYADGKRTLTLFKSVHPETRCDYYTGKIKYEGVVTCPDFDPDPSRQCGGGLH